MNSPLTASQADLNGSFVAMQAALRAVAPQILANAGTAAHTDKQDGSPVTATDTAVEQAIIAMLAEQYPDLPVYGEESGYTDDLSGTFWLVDPIDGTKSFIQNIPVFTSMAVLISGGEATAAIIYNPSTSTMYTAQAGQGAYRNGERIDLSRTPLPSIALCKERFIEPLNAVLEPQGITCQNGSSGGGYGFTRVLDGTAAARFNLHGGGYTHDYAPGALLIHEAGGNNVPILDDVYTYKTSSFVACHPALAELLLAQRDTLRALEQSPRD